MREFCLLAATVVVGLSLSGCAAESGPQPLVVYCAHDSLYADEVLKKFTEQTGIEVTPRYDTEATKSLGLVQQLIREKDQPRCDVFWNNQVLGTLQLKQEGVLEPYQGPGYERIPDAFKDPDGEWTGFAARLRVYIVNTEAMTATDEALQQALAADDLSQAAIAKPLFGTTLSHYSVLWDVWGPDKLKTWHADLRERGIREATGNATVKNLVAEGVCQWGLTDTDDFYVAADEGKPVEMLPVRVDEKATICIPNSVAIIKGTQQKARAQQLVDFLLSEETELAMAASKSRQIPLGPVDESKLSAEVKQLKEWAAPGYPLAGLAEARAQCLAWLKAEYAP
ncbi:extracellular solute-binding protein [Symmachiella dynata]|uniref:extracellular solute-binding protein n=1 Tax=Symmachiella dynata TaxID=2527995 RepID=UPI0030EC4B57